MAQEVTLIAPTGGKKSFPHVPGRRLNEYIAFAGFQNFSGQWYRVNVNNGNVAVSTDINPDANTEYILVPQTKGGL